MYAQPILRYYEHVIQRCLTCALYMNIIHYVYIWLCIDVFIGIYVIISIIFLSNRLTVSKNELKADIYRVCEMNIRQNKYYRKYHWILQEPISKEMINWYPDKAGMVIRNGKIQAEENNIYQSFITTSNFLFTVLNGKIYEILIWIAGYLK